MECGAIRQKNVQYLVQYCLHFVANKLQLVMKEIRLFKTDSGKEPFEDWLANIKDKTTKARIRRRIDRLVLGHEGDCKSVGKGLYEL